MSGGCKRFQELNCTRTMGNGPLAINAGILAKQVYKAPFLNWLEVGWTTPIDNKTLGTFIQQQLKNVWPSFSFLQPYDFPKPSSTYSQSLLHLHLCRTYCFLVTFMQSTGRNSR